MAHTDHSRMTRIKNKDVTREKRRRQEFRRITSLNDYDQLTTRIPTRRTWR